MNVKKGSYSARTRTRAGQIPTLIDMIVDTVGTLAKKTDENKNRLLQLLTQSYSMMAKNYLRKSDSVGSNS